MAASARARSVLLLAALLGLASLAHAEPAAPKPTPAGQPAAAAPAAAPSPPPVPTLDPARTLRVDYLDVGQGDAMLLRSYNGKTVLIDTGGPRARGKLKRALKAEGVTRIDALVLTHPHADHIGNAVTVLREFEVGIVYEPGYPHTAVGYRRVLETVEEKGIRYKKARDGMRIRLADDVELQILAPGDEFLDSERSVLNCTSVVLRLTYGKVRFLFPGDAEQEVEKQLLAKHPDELKADVYKVAHHGSRYTNHDDFLDKVRPSIAVIEVGRRNTYRHPTPETLARLKAHGVRTYTTAIHGQVTVTTDGTTILVKPQNDQPPL